LNSRRDVTKMDGNSEPSRYKKNPCKPKHRINPSSKCQETNDPFARY
jgi:hypothetical protein